MALAQEGPLLRLVCLNNLDCDARPCPFYPHPGKPRHAGGQPFGELVRLVHAPDPLKRINPLLAGGSQQIIRGDALVAFDPDGPDHGAEKQKHHPEQQDASGKKLASPQPGHPERKAASRSDVHAAACLF
ncbi:hypothetical protein D3C80_1538810 [compost metagenome]